LKKKRWLVTIVCFASLFTACGEDTKPETHDAGAEDGGKVPELCSANSCENGGTCSDASGAVVCDCAPGYAGATCSSCASGFQNNHGSTACQRDCESSGLGDCSGHGACSDADGTAACTCNPGYAGTTCETCATNYQDNDHDGTCSLTCAAVSTLSVCSGHGTCSDASGSFTCTCLTGYTGAACNACASGYQDRDGDGSCLANCATAALSCSGHASCVDTSGAAICSCAAGYTGSACKSCASGYQDNDGNGSCTANCETVALSCVPNSGCTDASGTAMCACNVGYTGVSCTKCTTGYQDNDNNGTCTQDCTAAPACTGALTCSDTSGTATCSCAAPNGLDGTTCVAGLVARWRMDENGGTVVSDSSGNGRDATASVVGWSPGAFSSGFSGKAYSNAALPLPGDVTIATWVARTGTGSGYSRFLELSNDILDLADYDHAGTLGLNLPWNGGWVDTGQAFGASTFNHVAVTITSGTTQLYWNGTLVRTYPYSGSPPSFDEHQLFMLYNDADNEDFIGILDDVRVYARALTSTEIQQLATP